MFRKAREDVSSSEHEHKHPLLPLVGRPPTPPQDSTSILRSSSLSSGPKATPARKLAGMKSQLVQQSLGFQSPANTGKVAFSSSTPRSKAQSNKSILSFFAKSTRSDDACPKGTEDQELFFRDPIGHEFTISPSRRSRSPTFLQHEDYDLEKDDDELRYNESSVPLKRLRTNCRNSPPIQHKASSLNEEDVGCSGIDGHRASYPIPVAQTIRGQSGPFVEDSDSQEEVEQPYLEEDASNHKSPPVTSIRPSTTPPSIANPKSHIEQTEFEEQKKTENIDSNLLWPSDTHEAIQRGENDEAPIEKPRLARETTSMGPVDEFDGMGDFDDEFFDQGEEYMERQMAEEERLLEEGLEDPKQESDEDISVPPNQAYQQQTSDSAALCPICNQSLDGTTEIEASTHVNSCLDGKPTPLPKSTAAEQKDAASLDRAENGAKRFQRAAIARPGQQNPFSPFKNGTSASAFSKLMSGHVEDAAWAAAAAQETSSRGKPAYQRTCPFYKIMPGLLICVDAFRYGKVQGQNAYFLSHFHSDHYIGLTSSWCHGPIYCSKVTANLVRRQLRVDPKWVVDLEFEKKVEVLGTNGVSVTMISANHCPGSSLYLFEKVVGKGPNPKLNRILHCGDFRACPAHVQHPLLRPEVVDSISGTTRQQTIDTCYLDTTYLTPKYAFPSQEDVINSCAEMCVSLSKDIPDRDDSWERARVERTGSKMAKFLENGSSDKSQRQAALENGDEDTPAPGPANRRGRLLVVIGTYSIGKERICVGIAKALQTKIYAPPAKQRICAALEDAELSSLLTTNPHEGQVHLQTLGEIRAETLSDYLTTHKSHFTRVVGFRPTGWSYRPPATRTTDNNPAVATVLHSDNWKSRFSVADLVPQRGSNRQSTCFGVPYSEHSSFRELTMFCCALNIGRVIPTVNVGSAKSRERMKAWIDRWEVEKRRNGLFRIEAGDGGGGW